MRRTESSAVQQKGRAAAKEVVQAAPPARRDLVERSPGANPVERRRAERQAAARAIGEDVHRVDATGMVKIFTDLLDSVAIGGESCGFDVGDPIGTLIVACGRFANTSAKFTNKRNPRHREMVSDRDWLGFGEAWTETACARRNKQAQEAK